MTEFIQKLYRGYLRVQLYSRLFFLNRIIRNTAISVSDKKPVIFFNASARLVGLNLNAAFSMIAGWGVQLAGRKIYHFACNSGMSHCVLGAGLGDPKAPPPCKGCIKDTERFTGSAPRFWFEFNEDAGLRKQLQGKSISELENFSYQGRPLGSLVLPSLRWILRRYHLKDDEVTQYLFSEYILSAYNIAEKISKMITEVDPDVVVVFNGLQYPEAVVRWVSQQNGIRVITHEVNLQPFSAFFTDGQATIYPLAIPDDFLLTERQNQILDEYLKKRIQGDFKMAGIKFWPEMNQLPEDLVDVINKFDSIVPVFTNVIFDTSQAHANTIFPDMFAWLDTVLDYAKKYWNILFVIRAHPDEMRVGKSSQENVLNWAADENIKEYQNIKLIGPDDTHSSYELIQHSKFTLVYNSSIGLEAILLGTPVLCAGKARYTQYPTVYYPKSKEKYQDLLQSFLQADKIEVPEEFIENARKFLFYQLYRASLRFDDFIGEGTSPGYIQLKGFNWRKLLPGNSDVVDCVVQGILFNEEFILESDQV